MLLRFLSVCSVISSVIASIKDCDSSSIFRPLELSVSPDPPVPGQPVYLTLIFDNTGSEITSGTVTTTLSINSIPFSPSTEPLCDNTKCPIVSGKNDRSTQNVWPSGVYGLVKSRITWMGPNNENLLCVDTAFKVATTSWWGSIKNSFKIESIVNDGS
jgi:hypothetical protein